MHGNAAKTINTVAGMLAAPTASQRARERAQGRHIAAENGELHRQSYDERTAEARAEAERKEAEAARKKAEAEAKALARALELLSSANVNCHAAPVVILRCAAFNTTDKRVPRELHVSRTFPVYAGGRVELDCKEELRQDDRRVWLALVKHATRNGGVKSFNVEPAKLLRDLGWSKGGSSKHSTKAHAGTEYLSSKDRLRASVKRLVQSSLTYYVAREAPPEGLPRDLASWITVLVSSADFEGTEWHVEVPESIARMYITDKAKATAAFLENSVSRSIVGSYASWLCDFIATHNGDMAFSMDVLQCFSDRLGVPAKAFKRATSKAMAAIKTAGGVRFWGIFDDKLYFTKCEPDATTGANMTPE